MSAALIAGILLTVVSGALLWLGSHTNKRRRQRPGVHRVDGATRPVHIRGRAEVSDGKPDSRWVRNDAKPWRWSR